MEDRLRALLDLVVLSLDDSHVDGVRLARKAHFSREHLDRLIAAATGEPTLALRRRLLLERAAWQLRVAVCSAGEAARAAGYGSLAAFSRAFSRAYGVPPSGFAVSERPVALESPNGIHFHPPAGLLLPGRTQDDTGRHDASERLLAHHLAHSHELLVAATGLPDGELRRDLRPGFVVVWFEGEEPSAALMAERLVFTLEVWIAAIAGRTAPDLRVADGAEVRLARHESAAPRFARLMRTIGARRTWADGFVDALCDPPQSFAYGDVLAHVLAYGAIRRHALADVLGELGAAVAPSSEDPLMRI